MSISAAIGLGVDADQSTAASTLAAQLVPLYTGRFIYDLGRQGWLQYGGRLEGIWSEQAAAVVHAEIRQSLTALLPEGYSWKLLQDVEHFLVTYLHAEHTRGLVGWLPFPNGALDLSTMTLHEHTPARLFTWCLPYPYDETITCPKTLQFLHEAVKNDHAQVQVLRGYGKAVLTSMVALQRFLELIGPGGTGKSTVVRLLTALLGIENVGTTELKHLETSRFETSSLVDKRLIAITDAERYGGSITNLKNITGQDPVRTEKKFKQPGSAVAEGLVILAANEPIQAADYTSGLARRRLTLHFTYKPHDPRDLISIQGGVFQGELVEELPGLFNWIMALPDAAVVALVKQTDTVVPTLAQARHMNLIETNPLAAWANQALVLERDQKKKAQVGIAKKVDRSNRYRHEEDWLYLNYRAYSTSTGHKPVSLQRFTSLLKDLLCEQLGKDVTSIIGRHGSQFVGIRLRTAKDTDTEALLIDETLPDDGQGDGPVMDVHHAFDRAIPGGDEGCGECDGLFENSASRARVESYFWKSPSHLATSSNGAPKSTTESITCPSHVHHNGATNGTHNGSPPPAFTDLTASMLWCQTCQHAQPVHLDGLTYQCTRCLTVVGTVTVASAQPQGCPQCHQTCWLDLAQGPKCAYCGFQEKDQAV